MVIVQMLNVKTFYIFRAELPIFRKTHIPNEIHNAAKWHVCYIMLINSNIRVKILIIIC
jgi:hypothetical protein